MARPNCKHPNRCEEIRTGFFMKNCERKGRAASLFPANAFAKKHAARQSAFRRNAAARHQWGQNAWLYLLRHIIGFAGTILQRKRRRL